jgi:hypothetical protein
MDGPSSCPILWLRFMDGSERRLDWLGWCLCGCGRVEGGGWLPSVSRRWYFPITRLFVSSDRMTSPAEALWGEFRGNKED